MKKEGLTTFAAVTAAFFSTICCVPPLLFLIFGISVGSLSFLSSLTYLRIPLAIVAIFLFLISMYQYGKKQKCCYNKTKTIKFIAVFLVMLGLLIYPETIVYFTG